MSSGIFRPDIFRPDIFRTGTLPQPHLRFRMINIAADSPLENSIPIIDENPIVIHED